MEDHSQRSALLTALTTEHFVLQTANGSTYTEASARSTLYVMALSASLIAMGFLASSREAFIPFVTVVLPAIFLLGLFTVARLVETALESTHCMNGIARIGGYYRTLGPDAAHHFAPEFGRWPEVAGPALRLGPTFAFFGTTASMIAVINNVVARRWHRAARSRAPHGLSPLDGGDRRHRRCARADGAVLCLPALALPRFRSYFLTVGARAVASPAVGSCSMSTISSCSQ